MTQELRSDIEVSIWLTMPEPQMGDIIRRLREAAETCEVECHDDGAAVCRDVADRLDAQLRKHIEGGRGRSWDFVPPNCVLRNA